MQQTGGPCEVAARGDSLQSLLQSTGLGEPASADVPFLGDEGQVAFLGYLHRPQPRAFAISNTGGWGAMTGSANDAEAVTGALAVCNRRSRSPCAVYHLDESRSFRYEQYLALTRGSRRVTLTRPRTPLDLDNADAEGSPELLFVKGQFRAAIAAAITQNDELQQLVGSTHPATLRSKLLEATLYEAVGLDSLAATTYVIALQDLRGREQDPAFVEIARANSGPTAA
jgi:hypothetical protein